MGNIYHLGNRRNCNRREGISEQIKYLHYEFEGWIGANLLESTPAFIVSSKLGTELENSDFIDYKVR